MLHLKIDLTGSTPDRLALALEAIMEEVAQGNREGPGFALTGEDEPEDNPDADRPLDDERPWGDEDDDPPECVQLLEAGITGRADPDEERP